MGRISLQKSSTLTNISITLSLNIGLDLIMYMIDYKLFIYKNQAFFMFLIKIFNLFLIPNSRKINKKYLSWLKPEFTYQLIRELQTITNLGTIISYKI